MKHTITAVIIAKNEEKRIEPCLESVKWCDEIVVVDDMSTDNTHQICRKFKANVVAHASNGNYDVQRNLGIDNSNSEWILQLDADERVRPELRKNIKEILRNNSSFSAYSLGRRNYFLGRFMKFGGWHERHVRLFKKGKGRYTGSVHERLNVNGKVGELRSDLDHYAFDSINQYITRQLYYASIESRVMYEDRFGKIGLDEIKYHLKVKPLKLFVKLFFKKQGFRDGVHGFVFSILNAWRHFMIWAIYYSRYYKGDDVR
ncbi:MAG: glycosyltransferase family 2 protein [Candidatus Omnitrophica bacterium]|nr:glycosyltransferase family 2 protein [Candidatus Omnitrophota bacterium]